MKRETKYVAAFMFVVWMTIFFMLVLKIADYRKKIKENELKQEQLINDTLMYKKPKDWNTPTLSEEKRIYYDHLMN